MSEKVACPRCGQLVTVTHSARGAERIHTHKRPDGERCRADWSAPEACPIGHNTSQLDPSAVSGVESNMNIVKGTRIRAEWFQANKPPSSLSGMQLKFGVTKFAVTGTVRHVRGDHPTNPTEVHFYIDPEGEWTGPTSTPPGCTCGPHVMVKPQHVVEVL